MTTKIDHYKALFLIDVNSFKSKFKNIWDFLKNKLFQDINQKYVSKFYLFYFYDLSLLIRGIIEVNYGIQFGNLAYFVIKFGILMRTKTPIFVYYDFVNQFDLVSSLQVNRYFNVKQFLKGSAKVLFEVFQYVCIFVLRSRKFWYDHSQL